MAGNEAITHDAARAPAGGTHTVRVVLNRCGEWEVALPGESELLTCDTLAQAQQLAYHCAASDRRPCEVVVFDAYHRVLHRESITDDEGAGRGSRR